MAPTDAEIRKHMADVDAKLAVDKDGKATPGTLSQDSITTDMYVDPEADPHGGNDNNRALAERIAKEREKRGLKQQQSPAVPPANGDAKTRKEMQEQKPEAPGGEQPQDGKTSKANKTTNTATDTGATGWTPGL